MNVSDVARTNVCAFPIWRREIFKQLDLVATGNSSNFLREFAALMRGMRELKSQHVAPKCERPFQVGDGDAGVIGAGNVKWHSRAHARSSLVILSATHSLRPIHLLYES